MLLFAVLFVLFIALAVFVQRKLPIWKGKVSESLVNQRLLELPDEYVKLNDLLFESNGHTTQIDHIVVSPYGVFVIETKGYKGWIMGGENTEYWTQVIYDSKHKFYNPIRQNEGHVRFLRYLLRCSTEIPFVPIVVFNDSADIKVRISDHIVVNRYNLLTAISCYRTKILSQETVYWIVKTLRDNCVIAGREELERHKNNVRSQQYRSQAKIAQGICPKCGGRLLLRQGRYGVFYGCSNYPDCKFTSNP